MKHNTGVTPNPFDNKMVIDIQMAKDETWLTTEDVIKHLKISRSSLYRLRGTNAIPAFKLGRTVVYPKSLINKFMLERALTELHVPTGS